MERSWLKRIKGSSIIIFWRKFVHSCLTPKFLWKALVTNYNIPRRQQEHRLARSVFLMRRLFWFWPTLQDSFFWRHVSVGEVMGPQDYAQISSHSQILVDELLDKCDDESRSFLDLGCNRGRFLRILRDAGMNNIEGVDICEAAIAVVREDKDSLDLADSIQLQTIQEFLLNKPSLSVDVIYTHGATVELIPSSFPLVKEISRVARQMVILYISETDYLYPRFWELEFKRFNFKLVKLVRPLKKSTSRFSLLVFERH